MAEQTFRSPGYFEREIDLSTRQEESVVEVPAGVIGASTKGPAFVPITFANFDQFKEKFGDLDPKYYGAYAANEWLKNRSALTFCRVLGAGANNSAADVQTTLTTGQVKNAGFVVTGSVVGSGDQRHKGCVQYLAAVHTLDADEATLFPMFSQNASYNAALNDVRIIRATVLFPSGARMAVFDYNQAVSFADYDDIGAASTAGIFKLAISSSLGSAFANDDGLAGIKIYSASLDPASQNYVGKLLNTNPDKFVEYQHLLYSDYEIDAAFGTAGTIVVMSGSSRTSTTSGDSTMTFRDAFGHFDTRYKTPKTPWFISQPFGNKEYDLFYVESLDDGEYANTLYKVSIANIKMSTDESYPYGTFSVQVRSMEDSDLQPVVLEQFDNCSLDPLADNFVAKLIGDRKISFNFDVENENERRLVVSGKYSNKSKYVRVVLNPSVEDQVLPKNCLPFGFRGIPALKTNDDLVEYGEFSANFRLSASGTLGTANDILTGSIVPPVPFRTKITKGERTYTSGFLGVPGATEVTSPLFYWGVKFEKVDSLATPETSLIKNKIIEAYAKFNGIEKLDVLVTGSAADTFNSNKFTLARVAFSQQSMSDLTGSSSQHMKEAFYFRSAAVDPTTYKVTDSAGGINRITLGTLAAHSSSYYFNRFALYNKFTTFMYGGFDGVNILDRDARRLNDKSLSFDAGGGAESSYLSPGLAYNTAGTSVNNNSVSSYITAAKIMTNPMISTINVLAIPGIREAYVTDTVMTLVRDYGLAYYVMDISSYDDAGARLYDDAVSRPDITKTISSLDSRAIDNNYAGTYFPDVFIDDQKNKRRVKVPASVAALSAISYNDRVAFPWFAPAGFNRAALDAVKNVTVRLNGNDRDELYEARINPIAIFPKNGYVIYGQKTLQQSKSALDRINVRRLLIDVKRQIVDIARRELMYSQNTPETRKKFVENASVRLGFIQTQFGVEEFRVIMDDSNNTPEDEDLNRLNGTIKIKPTKAVEFIAMDFVITNSGVEFNQ